MGGIETLLTTKDLAKRWKVSHDHLANLRTKGKGCRYVKLGGSVRYRIEDVEQYEIENTRIHEEIKR